MTPGGDPLLIFECLCELIEFLRRHAETTPHPPPLRYGVLHVPQELARTRHGDPEL